MMIKPSAFIRKNYKDVAELCKSTGEPVFLTNNGEGELVVMSIEAFEGYNNRMKVQNELLRLEIEKARGLARYVDIGVLDSELAEVIEIAENGQEGAI